MLTHTAEPAPQAAGGSQAAPQPLPSEPLRPELLATLAAAKQACASAAAVIEEKRAELTSRQKHLSHAKDELNRLVELEKDDLVVRILEGEDSRPKKPKRLSRIENLKQEIEGLNLAMPVIQGRVHEAQEALVSAQEQLTSAIIPALCAARAKALRQVRNKLADLAPDLARLVAADIVQERLVGREFTYTGAVQDLFSGRIVARRFIEVLTDRLRPPELALAKVEAAAETVASAFTASFAGEQ